MLCQSNFCDVTLCQHRHYMSTHVTLCYVKEISLMLHYANIVFFMSKHLYDMKFVRQKLRPTGSDSHIRRNRRQLAFRHTNFAKSAKKKKKSHHKPK